MPYIVPERRAAIDAGEPPVTRGELTYVFCQEAIRYVKRHGQSFESQSDVAIALECSKLEFYRMVLGPYEDEKRLANGDLDWSPSAFKKD